MTSQDGDGMTNYERYFGSPKKLSKAEISHSSNYDTVSVLIGDGIKMSLEFPSDFYHEAMLRWLNEKDEDK